MLPPHLPFHRKPTAPPKSEPATRRSPRATSAAGDGELEKGALGTRPRLAPRPLRVLGRTSGRRIGEKARGASC
jgi:hypothetical protein